MKDECDEAVGHLIPKCQGLSCGMSAWWNGIEALVKDMSYVCLLSADLFAASCGVFHFLFFKSTCSVPLSCCFSVLLLAALTEALSMFLQALS